MRRPGTSLFLYIVGLFIVLLLVGTLFYFIAVPFIASYLQKPQAQIPTGYKYTTGLIAYFQIYDKTGSAFITSDVSPEFYPLSENPFAYTFTGSPLVVGAYDSVKSAWKAVLDSGQYKLLVKDTQATPTKYPELVTITVPGTNNDNREVSIEPYMIKLVQRASVTITAEIKAFNETSGAYDITVTDINITAYDQWLVTYTFTIAGNNKVIKAGRIYLTKIPGLLIEKALLDGKQVSVLYDDNSADDGMTGYYIVMPSDWNGGEIHRLDLYLKDVGASTGTMTLTLFDYYACLNPNLRWWTMETLSINVVS